ncbi:MAG TPA: hypothetical protein VII13_14230 [Vicinamibacteria bacterium]|jgi:hypothetical protein
MSSADGQAGADGARTEAEWAAWARQHRVAFEVAPIVEARRDERMQVGFTLQLYAALPMDKPRGEQREDAVRRLREDMVAFMRAAVPSDKVVASVEMERPRKAAVLRPENQLQPEISLTWRILHADEFWKPVTTGEREGLARVEKRLVTLGLRQGHW